MLLEMEGSESTSSSSSSLPSRPEDAERGTSVMTKDDDADSELAVSDEGVLDMARRVAALPGSRSRCGNFGSGSGVGVGCPTGEADR
jgi:hypothetical protein